VGDHVNRQISRLISRSNDSSCCIKHHSNPQTSASVSRGLRRSSSNMQMGKRFDSPITCTADFPNRFQPQTKQLIKIAAIHLPLENLFNPKTSRGVAAILVNEIYERDFHKTSQKSRCDVHIMRVKNCHNCRDRHHFVFKFTQRNHINRIEIFITDFRVRLWVQLSAYADDYTS
jgi:hypothetical protein